MNNDQAIEIFVAAKELPLAEREAFLTQACGTDAVLRREVESWLAHAKTNDSLFAKPVFKLIPSLTGEQISHYQIQKLLGAGGMGEVYLAQDTTLSRPVALKVLPLAFTRDDARVQRFKQEAHTISKLNHPNIITIHEVGEHTAQETTQHYLVTEYVVGQTLRERLKAARLNAAQAVDVAIQITDALRVAHKAAIIHRDIKPENVMLCDEGDLVKVLDFGIAKLGQGDGETGRRGEDELAPSPHRPVTPSLTSAGAIMGTASYMSPEQAAGLPVDERTDVYAVGLVLYEMLTGQRVPRDEAGLLKLGNGLKSVPTDLAATIRKAVKPKREDRYVSAAALLTDLRRVQERLRNARLRRRLVAAVAAAVLLLVVTSSSIWLARGEEWEESPLHDGHSNQVRQFALSPNGRKLVSVSHDSKIIVWDFASRARLATLTHNNQQRVTAVAFAPDGQSFATACADGTVNVWDAKSYALRAIVSGYASSVARVLFSPNGRWLLTATGGQQHTLWEIGSWKKVHDFVAPGLGAGTNPLFSPDSRFLLSQFWELFDLEKGVASNTRSLPSWSNSTLSPDAKQLVTVDPSNMVSFWDAQQMWTGGEKQLLKREVAYRDRGRAVAYSADGRYVATAGEAILLWDAKTKTKLARFTYHQYPWHLEFTPDSKSLVASYGDAQLLVWDVEEREQQFSFVGHSSPVRAVAYAPDGKRIASAGDDQSVILWDVATGQKRAAFSQHGARISALEFSRDGKSLISTDIHGKTFIWDVEAERERLHFETPGRWDIRFGFAASISPDQHWIATSFGVHSSADGRMVVDFDNKSGYASSATEAKQEYYAIRFSPDGRRMVGVKSTHEVNLWDTATWTMEQRAQVKQEGGANLISLAFSPDGHWFITGQDQGQIRLWSVEPLREVAVIGQHKSYVRFVTFSHDGRFVASASDDKTLKLWDVARRKPVEEIGIHTSPVLSVAFSPDDNQLVTGEYDNSVRVYTRRQTWFGRQWD